MATITASQAVSDLLRMQRAYQRALDHHANPSEFVEVVESITWDAQPPEVFYEAVNMAITLEAIRLARRLAAQGLALYPDNVLLARRVEVLAPPRILETDRPPVPEISETATWVEQNASHYPGLWIAVLSTGLIATAPTRRELVEKIGEAVNRRDLIVVKVLE